MTTEDSAVTTIYSKDSHKREDSKNVARENNGTGAKTIVRGTKTKIVEDTKKEP